MKIYEKILFYTFFFLFFSKIYLFFFSHVELPSETSCTLYIFERILLSLETRFKKLVAKDREPRKEGNRVGDSGDLVKKEDAGGATGGFPELLIELRLPLLLHTISNASVGWSFVGGCCTARLFVPVFWNGVRQSSLRVVRCVQGGPCKMDDARGPLAIDLVTRDSFLGENPRLTLLPRVNIISDNISPAYSSCNLCNCSCKQFVSISPTPRTSTARPSTLCGVCRTRR